MFLKIGVLKNSVKFTEKYRCWSIFLIKSGLQLVKFLVKLAKFLRAPFSTEHLRCLLLNISYRKTDIYISFSQTLLSYRLYQLPCLLNFENTSIPCSLPFMKLFRIRTKHVILSNSF